MKNEEIEISVEGIDSKVPFPIYETAFMTMCGLYLQAVGEKPDADNIDVCAKQAITSANITMNAMSTRGMIIIDRD